MASVTWKTTDVALLGTMWVVFITLHLLKESISQTQRATELAGSIDFFGSVVSLFFHVSWSHILMNLVSITVVVYIFRNARNMHFFLLLFLSSGILGNIAVDILLDGNILLIGSSGGIMGLYGFTLTTEAKNIAQRVIQFSTVLFVASEIYTVLGPFRSAGALGHIVGFLLGLMIVAGYMNKTLSLESLQKENKWKSY